MRTIRIRSILTGAGTAAAPHIPLFWERWRTECKAFRTVAREGAAVVLEVVLSDAALARIKADSEWAAAVIEEV